MKENKVIGLSSYKDGRNCGLKENTYRLSVEKNCGKAPDYKVWYFSYLKVKISFSLSLSLLFE